MGKKVSVKYLQSLQDSYNCLDNYVTDTGFPTYKCPTKTSFTSYFGQAFGLVNSDETSRELIDEEHVLPKAIASDYQTKFTVTVQDNSTKAYNFKVTINIGGKGNYILSSGTTTLSLLHFFPINNKNVTIKPSYTYTSSVGSTTPQFTLQVMKDSSEIYSTTITGSSTALSNFNIGTWDSVGNNIQIYLHDIL